MLAWLFGTILPLIFFAASDYQDHWNTVYYYLEDTVHLNNIVLFFIPAFTIAVSIAVSHYLYAPASVSVIHVLPFTRLKLFLTNFASGLLLIWLPIIVSYLIMLLFVPGANTAVEIPPTTASAAFYPGEVVMPTETIQSPVAKISLYPELFQGLGITLLTTAFYLALFNLAAMLCGNVIMHIITSGFLTAAPIALLGSFVGLASLMLKGYSTPANFDKLMFSTNPLIYFWQVGVKRGGYEGDTWALSAGAVIAFIVAIAVMVTLGVLLYKKRQLERHGDSIVFKFMEIVFVSLITYGGMLIMALIVMEIAENSTISVGNEKIFNIGLAIGGVVCFILAKMAANKTIRVFNKGAVLHFGITVVVTLLLMLSFKIDIYGYETRIPNENDIVSVKLLQAGNFLPNAPGYGAYVFTDAANIHAMRETHNVAIANRNVNEEKYGCSVNLEYTLANGKTMRRYYTLSYTVFKTEASVYAEQIYNTEEFKDQQSVLLAMKDAQYTVTLSANIGNGYYSNGNFTLSSEEQAEFMQLADMDIRSTPYELSNGGGNAPFVYIYAYVNPINAEQFGDTALRYGREIVIEPHFTNTINWLIRHGYYEKLTSNITNFTKVIITEYRDDDIALRVFDGEVVSTSESEDLEYIRWLIENATNYPVDLSHYYELRFVMSKDDINGTVGYIAEVRS